MTIQACISGTQYGVAIFVQDRRSFCIHPLKTSAYACMHARTHGLLEPLVSGCVVTSLK